MNILFIHQNFPAQFKYLAPALAQRGHNVFAMIMQNNQPKKVPGVTLIPYTVTKGSTPNIHPWLTDFEPKIIRA
tara:strand:+ start:63 stop:284 length:222 start_codon:yes stop_codon:yes gene_type:complete